VKYGAGAGTGLHIDAAAMGAHDAVGDRQAQAGAVAAGGEKRLEQAITVALSMPRPIVAYRNINSGLIPPRREFDAPLTAGIDHLQGVFERGW
jgi:hypothetical protein